MIFLPHPAFGDTIPTLREDIDKSKKRYYTNEDYSEQSENENKANIGRFLHEILSKNTSQTLENTNVSMDYPLKQARENFEKNYLLTQLKKNKGNISKTAEFIGMERSALHRKLKSLGIKGIN